MTTVTLIDAWILARMEAQAEAKQEQRRPRYNRLREQALANEAEEDGAAVPAD